MRLHIFFGKSGGRGQSSIVAGMSSLLSSPITIDANLHNQTLSLFCPNSIVIAGGDKPPSIIVDEVMDGVIRAIKQKPGDILLDLSPELSTPFLDQLANKGCAIWEVLKEEGISDINVYHIITPHTFSETVREEGAVIPIAQCCSRGGGGFYLLMNEFYEKFSKSEESTILEYGGNLPCGVKTEKMEYSAAAQRLTMREIVNKRRSPVAARAAISGIYRGRVDEHIGNLKRIITLSGGVADEEPPQYHAPSSEKEEGRPVAGEEVANSSEPESSNEDKVEESVGVAMLGGTQNDKEEGDIYDEYEEDDEEFYRI